MTRFFTPPESEREKNQYKKMLSPQHQQMIPSALCTFKLFFIAWCWHWPWLKEISEHNLWNHLLVLSLFGKIKTLHGKTCKYVKKTYTFLLLNRGGEIQEAWICTGNATPHGDRYEIHDIQPQLCKNCTSTLNGPSDQCIEGNKE